MWFCCKKKSKKFKPTSQNPMHPEMVKIIRQQFEEYMKNKITS